MSKYLILVTEFEKDNDIPKSEHTEPYDKYDPAYERMMGIYNNIITAENPDPKVETSDHGKYWASVDYVNGDRTTIEILEEV